MRTEWQVLWRYWESEGHIWARPDLHLCGMALRNSVQSVSSLIILISASLGRALRVKARSRTALFLWK